MRFTKGHGTGNDFVILDDPDGEIDLTPRLVAALCDRHRGIGGDGVLRVLRTEAGFFMDYWNSDGSLSEMCGNGVRVFARYLLHAGYATGPAIPIGTRAGLKTAYVEGDQIRVDMGPPEILGKSDAVVDGVTYAGLAVSMGNPHLVCPVKAVDQLDLHREPGFDTSFFPDGVNVEFSEFVGPDHLRMRVYERGSGETLSCGTGVCATAYAYLAVDGRPPATRTAGPVTVDVPGGRLVAAFDGRTSWLTGPAILVASGEVQV